jgi:hypothetical protein
MRKVFLVLLVLSLGGFMVACSEDDTTPITPTPPDFGINTSVIEQGYTCTPYNVMLEAVGGTQPYTWSLAAGSTLPDGVTLDADGRIHGLLDAAGEWTFSVVCTDAAGTPHTDEVELTLNVDVPANPSIAIFYDGDATVCGSETLAFTPLDCYVFIMLEDGAPDCAWAAEFRISIEDENGNVLTPGTQYTHSYITYDPEIALTMGDPFGGIAMTFSREMPYAYYGDLHIMTFGLLLLEDLDNLTFRVGPSPNAEGTRPIIAACDDAHSVVEVNGRAATLNYEE